MQKRPHKVQTQFNDREIAIIDEFRGAMTRAAFLRNLVSQAQPQSGCSYAEALQLLTDSARNGSVAAQIALARELRRASAVSPQDEVDSAIARILGG